MSEKFAPLLLVFVKYPEAGRVKTRLGKEVGIEQATAIYRTMVKKVLEGIPNGQAIRVLYDGFRSEDAYREWLKVSPEAEFRPQAEGDLGNRLEAAFTDAFADGWKRVGVIGSDCLELTPELYMNAWAALETHNLILGPTFDGGYYFLAVKEKQAGLFANISWSSEVVCTQTLAAAEVAELSFFLLPKLHDVDTLADWERAVSAVGQMP